MTLKEFVKNFMEVNGITTSVDEMVKKITEYAKSQAVAGSACLSEEQVEDIILGKIKVEEKAPSETKKADEEKNKKAIEKYNAKMKEDKKVIMWHQNAPTYEVNGEKMEQMDLFGDTSL